MSETFTIGVIISTFNSPAWLEKTLWGYERQTLMPSEIIIADDGSGDDTRRLIDDFRRRLPIIRHVWHEHNGFQKSQILNKAIVESRADYLIFTDQDCIPRFDFVETHRRYARKGHLLSGGYFRLSMDISHLISEDDIDSRRAFDLKWLESKGLQWSWKCTKLIKSPVFTSLMDHITPTKATWNGCNASGWRSDIMAVNGFNEEMHYGGQDREFGERLFNYGVRGIQLRYKAICLHLDHKRPYKTRESIERNKAIRRETRRNKVIQTPYGITKIKA